MSASVVPGPLLDRLVEKWPKLVGMVLFGSSARGEAVASSDVDLLLVFPPRSRISRSLYREWDELIESVEASDRTIPLSPQFVSLPDKVTGGGGIWYEVAIEGIVLWERRLLLSRFLRDIREKIAEGHIRRAMVHGNPYWMKNTEAAHEK